MPKHPVSMGRIRIGEGRPKIFAPIVGRTREEILSGAKAVLASGADAAEWRVDFYGELTDLSQLTGTLEALRGLLGEQPLLFTIRSRREGGEVQLSGEALSEVIRAAAESGCVDAVDVEMLGDEALAQSLVRTVHGSGLPVIGSYHDFAGTPPKEEIVRKLVRMQELGADIVKIAVMPKSPADVLSLLAATEEMDRCHGDTPLVTMSMGSLGVASRIAGGVFGSAVTFASAGASSAPGQVPVGKLREVLTLVHGQD